MTPPNPWEKKNYNWLEPFIFGAFIGVIVSVGIAMILLVSVL